MIVCVTKTVAALRRNVGKLPFTFTVQQEQDITTMYIKEMFFFWVCASTYEFESVRVRMTLNKIVANKMCSDFS